MKTALIAIDVHRSLVPKGDPILHRLELAAQESDLIVIVVTRGADLGTLHPRIRRLGNYTVTLGQADFSAFAGETLRPKISLEEILKKNSISKVLVGGFHLDLRVRYTALDAAALGYLTIVALDCTRGFEAKHEPEALEDFKRAGVLVQTMAGWSER